MKLSEYSLDVWEAAKYSLHASKSADNVSLQQFFLRGALWNACSFLEAEIKVAGEHFIERGEIATFELGVMTDKKVNLIDGQFELSKTYSGQSMIDRFQFFIFKFDPATEWSSLAWLPQFKSAVSLRNRITHPDGAVRLTEAEVSNALDAILCSVSHLYSVLYKTRFPKYKAGLGITSAEFS